MEEDNQKVEDYVIARGENVQELSSKVISLLEEGFILYGFPYMSRQGYHYQPMIKYQD